MQNSDKYIIWDWNGTLINDVELCLDLFNQNIAEHGHQPVSLERYRSAYQHPIKAMYHALGVNLSDEEFQAMSKSFLAKYEKLRANCQLHDGALEALQELKQRDVPMSILSAHKHDLLHAAVNEFQVTSFFEHIIGLELGGGHSKIENGRELIARIACENRRFLLVGDSVHDHEVAEDLQIECHLIASGADCQSKLEKTGQKVFKNLNAWLQESEVL